ncbi:MAG: RdgB/HAM1 family non-canonical purine NTP pyrophosphatase [Bdellovibrionia bacterium]
MRLSKRVLLATTNRHKFEEFQALLRPYPEVQLVAAEALVRNPGQLQNVEKHSTYLENAIAKARLANQCSHYPSLADDSGLEVMALEGRPGVKSHRYAPAKPFKSQDEANVDLLLSELKNASSRQARFVCTVALVVEGILIHAQGILDGQIATAPRGLHGFGYDPIFIPNGSDKTLAEMTDEEKNKISHRKHALENLMAQVKSHGIILAKP